MAVVCDKIEENIPTSPQCMKNWIIIELSAIVCDKTEENIPTSPQCMKTWIIIELTFSPCTFGCFTFTLDDKVMFVSNSIYNWLYLTRDCFEIVWAYKWGRLEGASPLGVHSKCFFSILRYFHCIFFYIFNR